MKLLTVWKSRGSKSSLAHLLSKQNRILMLKHILTASQKENRVKRRQLIYFVMLLS